MHNNFWKYNLPWLIWLALISYLSNTRSSGIPDLSFLNFEGADKLVHAVFYFNLSFLMAWGFKKQQKYILINKNYYLFPLLFSIAWGGMMELAQWQIFTYRKAEWFDFLANDIGAFMGILFAFLLDKTRKLLNL